MSALGFTVFATPVGACAIAWSGRGIRGVQLPERSAAEARARMRRRFPDAQEGDPPGEVRAVADAIVALLSGRASDLSQAALDLEGVSEFNRRVYEIARSIAPGATLTYGEIAARLGAPGEARAVGAALGANPFPIVVPCHRVLGADGKAGGFSARGGLSTKMRLLNIERAKIGDAPALFDDLPLAAAPRRGAGSKRLR